jgi:iron complex outermembrane receptor protein
MKNLIWCCFLLSQFALFAQPVKISGTIKDAASGELLAGAVVSCGSVSVPSGNDGTYSLQTDQAFPLILKCTMLGYTGKTLTLQGPGNADFSLESAFTELSQVVVSAGKFEQKLSDVTVSMEVLKPTIVDNKNTYNLETIIDQVPGVTIFDGQANIRAGSGFSYGAGSRVLVLVDDMPLLAADANDVKWSYLPIENLEQIEVIKGASSALFGSSALNGVINIRTTYPKEKPETKIIAFMGAYDEPMRGSMKWWPDANPITTGSSFSHTRRIGNLDLVAGGNVFSDQGYREGETEQRGRANLNLRYHFKKVKGLSLGLNLNQMETRGGLFIIWQDADSGAWKPRPGSLSNYRTFRSNIDPYITYTTEKGDKHTLRTRYFNTTNTNNTNQESIAELYYGEYQFRKNFKRGWVMNTGLMATRSMIISDSLYGTHSAKNVALYGQTDKKFGRLTLSFGARGEFFQMNNVVNESPVNLVFMKGIRNKEFIRDTANGVSSTYKRLEIERDSVLIARKSRIKPVLRFGLNYQAAEFTFLRASIGQGYRFPSVAERFVNTSVSALSVFPNDTLRPESGVTAEIGVKQGFRIGNFNGFIDVAGFWQEYRDMMEFTFGVWFPENFPVSQQNVGTKFEYLGFKSVNVGNTRISGFEVSVTGAGKIGPVNVLFLGGYSYTKPINLNYRFDDTTGLAGPLWLKYRFFHLAKADLQLDWKGFTTGISARYQSFLINIDPAFEEELTPYVLPGNNIGIYILPGLKRYREVHRSGNITLDYRLGYDVNKSTRVSIIINNLLNAENMGRPGDLQPPRQIMVQYALKF